MAADSKPAGLRSAAAPSKGVTMMIYGVPGVGKTRLIGTGAKSLILRPPTDHTDSIEDPEKVDELVMPDWTTALEAFQWLHGGGGKAYNWVWLDSISLFQDHGLDDIWADTVAKKPSRAEFGLDKGEYGVNMFRLQQWIRNMVGLASEGAFNFGLTAHPFHWYDPIREEEVLAPWIQGRNMMTKITGYMNIVGYYRLVERDGKPDKRVLYTDQGAAWMAKDQFDALSGRMVEPTMPKIEKAIKDARKARASRTTTTPSRPKRRTARR